MAVDVNKLIKDAKAAQNAARAAAQEAQNRATKTQAEAEVAAQSKKQLEYADSLKPTLADYEARLRIFANKIARGDKLSAIEQKDFNSLVNNYKSVNKTIDSAIKRANDIIVEARRTTTPTTTKTSTAAKTNSSATGPDAARMGLTTPTAAADVAAATLPNVKTSTGNKVSNNPAVNKTVIADSAGAKPFTQPMTIAGQTDGVAGTPEVKSSLDTLLAKTEFWYDLPDYIFKLEPKLGELLVQAVDTNMSPEIFLSKAKLTPWWQKNSSTIRTRIVDRAKYDELKAAGEDVTKSDYGLYLSKQMRSVKAKAKEIAGVTLTDEQAQSVAGKIYDGFLDDDPLAINALIVPFIGKVTSIVGTGTGTTGFSGQALQNYQTLQGIAKANGFTLKDILPNVSALTAGGDMETAVLRGLADGSLDINRISQDARMLAAQGQPQYVRGLLSQGYDLQDIYAPYRSTMASTLEIDPNTIDLNDPTLRAAITDKGDMNMYDYKKTLRQDNRWQYTGAAKQDVSNAALGVLRDFGFQG